MKTDVYDSPEDKAEAINSLLDTDKGAVNKYLQSLAPEDKYRQDLSLMHGMHFNRMRDQDLNMMKQKANKKRERIDFGLGEFSG
jgi:hypothetical protein